MFGRKIFALAASIAVIGANSLALSPIARAVAGSFPGLDAAGVMKAAAAYGLATAASALVLGPAIDRIGPHTALLRALIGFVAALAISALAPSLAILCLGQVLAGLAAGCALPAIYALSSRVAEKGREKETLGVVLVGWTASLVVGVSLSAALADLVHWRVVFAALAAAAGWAVLEIRRGDDWPRSVAASAPTSPFAAFRVRGIAPALTMVATYMTAFYGLYTYLGPHLTEVLGVSTAAAGLASLAYGIGFGLAAFVDRFLDRYGAATAGPPTFLTLALAYLALAAASAHVTILLATCVAWGFANHVGLNLIVSRLNALDPKRSGAIMGLYSAVTYLAVAAGALLYQPLFRSSGFAGAALASAACVVPTLAMSVADALRNAHAAEKTRATEPRAPHPEKA